VSQLAASQTLVSPKFSSASTVVGTGTLTFSLGNPTYATGSSGAYSAFAETSSSSATITVDSTNNTPAGIRDAVNSANIGITASLLVDGSETRLIFTSDASGADTAMQITASDSDGNDADSQGLSVLSYFVDTTGGSPVFTGNLSETRASKDAIFSLNGLSLSNSSNQIAGLIDGLDFRLKAVTSSSEAVTIQQDSVAIEEAMSNFVAVYNNYVSVLDSLTDYEVSGALAGDATARRIQNVVREATTNELVLSGVGITAISTLGVEADRYGKLSFDAATFQSKLSTNLSDVKAFLSGNTVTTSLDDNTDDNGLADRLSNVLSVYTASTGLLSTRQTRVTNAISDISDQRLDVIARMEVLEERYTKQFAAMDTLVGNLQSTSNFLTNQMDALKAAANR
jgi:flagellar hook-associated protein 2